MSDKLYRIVSFNFALPEQPDCALEYGSIIGPKAAPEFTAILDYVDDDEDSAWDYTIYDSADNEILLSEGMSDGGSVTAAEAAEACNEAFRAYQATGLEEEDPSDPVGLILGL